MSDRMLILWLALLGASRIDLLGGAGPFVLTPFLALSPLLVGLELWRVAGEGWRPRVPVAAAPYLLAVSLLLALLLASTFLSYDLETSAQRFALLFVHVYLVFLLGLAVADRPDPGRILFRGAAWGLGVAAAFSGAQLLVWLTGYAGPALVQQAIDLDPRTYFGVIPRLTGASQDANLGGFLVLFHLALVLLHAPPSRLRRWLVRAAILLVLLTLSRSALLAGLTLWGFTALRGRELRIGMGQVGAAAAALGAATVLLLASPLTMEPLLELGGMLGYRLSPEEGSALERFELLVRAWEVGTESVKHALLGIGYGNAYVVLQDIFPGHPYANFHVLFATIFAESGAPAALLAVWIFLQAFLRAGIYRPLVGALIVFNVFQQAHTEPWLWLALMLAWMGIGALEPEGAPQETRQRAPQKPPQKAAFPLASLFVIVLATGLAWTPAGAQEPEVPVPAAFEVFAGGELENYLRTLQNVGRAAPYPWAARALSAGEVRGLGVAGSGHPWANRLRFDGEDERSLEYGLIRPRALTVYNSAFPFGGNDGPMWAGRGLTGAVQLGAYARWGPVSLVVAPVAFRSQNRELELAPAGGGELSRFRNPLTPTAVDAPQRFGADSYGRLDAGNSTLRVDAAGLAAGLSTAAQQWGGAQAHPLMLGPNAGGFAHAFVGTGRPLDVWIGSLHGRIVVGRLESTEYAFIRSDIETTRRLAVGSVAAFQPRGLPGLELGLARFSHRPWPDGGASLSDFGKPFETLIGSRVEVVPDNELASVFARWNVPSAGFEIFGEFIRIDGSYDFRTFMREPDDLSGYAAGFRRVWEGPGGAQTGNRLTVLRAEWLSTVSSHRERGSGRGLGQRARPMYQHSQLRQGHTHRGQLLASPAGHGGQGSTVAVDRYNPDGRWSVEFERRLERDRTVRPFGDDPADVDVAYALGVEAVRFRGPVDLLVGVRGVYNLNRHFQDDAFNLNVRLGATATF